MQSESIDHVADFYSIPADYTLRSLPRGKILVAGSKKRYKNAGRSILWAAVLKDRALVSTQYELVPTIRDLVMKASSPRDLLAEKMRNRLIALCAAILRPEEGCYVYDGVKLYCNERTYVPIADENVRRITRQTAGQAMARLRPVGIPDDVDYLLADDAAFAYYVEDQPVAFAGTHPAGPMSDRIGDAMVGTLEQYRRRGYGKAVASATTGELLRQERVTVWGAAADNVAAIKTASSVGFQLYCRVFEIRFSGG